MSLKDPTKCSNKLITINLNKKISNKKIDQNEKNEKWKKEGKKEMRKNMVFLVFSPKYI